MASSIDTHESAPIMEQDNATINTTDSGITTDAETPTTATVQQGDDELDSEIEIDVSPSLPRKSASLTFTVLERFWL